MQAMRSFTTALSFSFSPLLCHFAPDLDCCGRIWVDSWAVQGSAPPSRLLWGDETLMGLTEAHFSDLTGACFAGAVSHTCPYELPSHILYDSLLDGNNTADHDILKHGDSWSIDEDRVLIVGHCPHLGTSWLFGVLKSGVYCLLFCHKSLKENRQTWLICFFFKSFKLNVQVSK